MAEAEQGALVEADFQLEVAGEDRDGPAVRPELAEAASIVSATRQRMRQLSPELDEFLFRWGYTQTLVHPSNIGREFELAPWLSQRQRQAIG